MRTTRNKVLIIVLVVVAILAIVGGVFAYLFFCTDVLKSGQELFAKYLTQNMDELSQTLRIDKAEEIENKLKQNNYEENITISYAETDETEPIGQITIDTQNDPINQKNYGIVGLSMNELEDILEIEYMRENDAYSFRLTNGVKQFITVENRNLKQLAKNLKIDEALLELIPDTIDFEQFSFEELTFTEEEKNTEINKYANLLYSNIAKEKYTKTKNVVITVNGKTITTNAYALTLNEQEIKTLVIKVLETLKQDEIILAKVQALDEKLQEYSEESIKDSFVEALQEEIDELNEQEVAEEKLTITVYEQNKSTVRIKLEKNIENITLDTIAEEGKKQVNLKYSNIDQDNTQISDTLTFIKENDSKLTIYANSIEGEEQHGVEITAELVENGENDVTLDVNLDTEYGQFSFTRNIIIVDEISYKVTLDNSNNIVLNGLTSEQIQNIFNIITKRLTTDYIEPLKKANPLLMAIILGDSVANGEGDMETQLFNSQFESYEGSGKTAKEINMLLNTVLNTNLAESQKEAPKYISVSGSVNLDHSKTTVEEKAEEGKNYTVMYTYSDYGFIDTITVIEE